MDLSKVKRLGQLATKLGVGAHTLVEHLQKHGYSDVDPSPNTKLDKEQIELLIKDFHKDIQMKEKARSIKIGGAKGEESVGKTIIGGARKSQGTEEDVLIKGAPPAPAVEEPVKAKEAEEEKVEVTEKPKIKGPKIVGSIDLTKGKKEKAEPEEKAEKAEPKVKEEAKAPEVQPEKAEEKKEEAVDETIVAKADKLKGPKILGKIDLPTPAEKKKKPVASSSGDKERTKQRKRKRIVKGGSTTGSRSGAKAKVRPQEREITEKEIEEKLSSGNLPLTEIQSKSQQYESFRHQLEILEMEWIEIQDQIEHLSRDYEKMR